MNTTIVEYLSTNHGEDVETKESIVAITFRLDPNSFRPTNLILSKEQAKRLLADLTLNLGQENECTING